MFCAKCGHSLPDQAKFCPACGQPCVPGGYRTSALTSEHSSKSVYRKRRTMTGLAIALPVLAILLLATLFLTGVLPLPFQTHPGMITRPSNGSNSTTFSRTTPGRQPTSTTSTSQQETSASQPRPPAEYAYDKILDYFEEIALKREYGGGSFDGVVCRWEDDIRVQVDGEYRQEDYDCLLDHIDYLNSLGCLPNISIVRLGANYHVHFTELDRMAEVIPGYVAGNWGFISLNWDANGRIFQANMGIATDVTSQVQRNHLILEEFTQGLGLLNDSPLYPDSIFQIEWTETQSLSNLDEWVIRLLYSPAIYAGMKDGVRDSLTGWLLAQYP